MKKTILFLVVACTFTCMSFAQEYVIFNGEGCDGENYTNPWWSIGGVTVEVPDWLNGSDGNKGAATIWRNNENDAWAGGGIDLDLDISAYNKLSIDINKRVEGEVQIELQDGDARAYLKLPYTPNGGWQTLVFDLPGGWTHLTALLAAPHNVNTTENPINFDEDDERHRMSWDNVKLYVAPLVIPADGAKSASVYRFGDIIFESAGQLTDIPSEGLPITGVVKLKKTFITKQWYPIGFPFDIASVQIDYELAASTSGTDGDYWLKTYNAPSFVYNQTIAANTGYIIQFPNAFEGGEVTFISEDNPTLKNLTEGGLDFSENGYHLVANPSVNNLTLETANKYYIYNSATNNFALLQNSTAVIKPFEAFIVVNGVDASQLKSSLNIEEATALETLNVIGDKVIKTEYYTLQGIKIQQPAVEGIYIVKKVYESQKAEVSKVFYKK